MRNIIIILFVAISCKKETLEVSKPPENSVRFSVCWCGGQLSPGSRDYDFNKSVDIDSINVFKESTQ